MRSTVLALVLALGCADIAGIDEKTSPPSDVVVVETGGSGGAGGKPIDYLVENRDGGAGSGGFGWTGGREDGGTEAGRGGSAGKGVGGNGGVFVTAGASGAAGSSGTVGAAGFETKETCPGMVGFRPPAGTVVTGVSKCPAQAEFLPHAVDCIMGSGWNACDYSGTIALSFPKPTQVSAIQIVVTGSSGVSVVYTITGTKNGVSEVIGQGSRSMPPECPPMICADALDVISVTPGEYDKIEISGSGATWITFFGVTILLLLLPEASTANESKHHVFRSPSESISRNTALV